MIAQAERHDSAGMMTVIIITIFLFLIGWCEVLVELQFIGTHNLEKENSEICPSRYTETYAGPRVAFRFMVLISCAAFSVWPPTQ